MKKVILMFVNIVAIGACGKVRDDSTLCTCTNLDGEEVASYTGLNEDECSDNSDPYEEVYCTLR